MKLQYDIAIRVWTLMSPTNLVPMPLFYLHPQCVCACACVHTRHFSSMQFYVFTTYSEDSKSFLHCELPPVALSHGFQWGALADGDLELPTLICRFELYSSARGWHRPPILELLCSYWHSWDGRSQDWPRTRSHPFALIIPYYYYYYYYYHY